jgi:hypothetical protein
MQIANPALSFVFCMTLFQYALNLHFSPTYTMSLVPMQLCSLDFPVGKSNQRGSFEFAPTATAKTFLQLLKLPDRHVNGYGFNVLDRPDQLELSAHAQHLCDRP